MECYAKVGMALRLQDSYQLNSFVGAKIVNVASGFATTYIPLNSF